jgi:hypothetical protein
MRDLRDFHRSGMEVERTFISIQVNMDAKLLHGRGFWVKVLRDLH